MKSRYLNELTMESDAPESRITSSSYIKGAALGFLTTCDESTTGGTISNGSMISRSRNGRRPSSSSGDCLDPIDAYTFLLGGSL